jgi:formylglycine-generating enzyme
MAVSRSATATWVLPTRDEWYKCAYYSGWGTNSAYWLYPTQSNDTPSNVLSSTGTNNANYFSSTLVNGLTPVGAFASSPGEYGTFDMGGNVWQWEDSVNGSQRRGLRGGSYADTANAMLPYSADDTSPSLVDSAVGFRVAYVPEPSSFCLLLASAIVLTFFKVRHSLLTKRGE